MLKFIPLEALLHPPWSLTREDIIHAILDQRFTPLDETGIPVVPQKVVALDHQIEVWESWIRIKMAEAADDPDIQEANDEREYLVNRMKLYRLRFDEDGWITTKGSFRIPLPGAAPRQAPTIEGANQEISSLKQQISLIMEDPWRRAHAPTTPFEDQMLSNRLFEAFISRDQLEAVLRAKGDAEQEFGARNNAEGIRDQSGIAPDTIETSDGVNAAEMYKKAREIGDDAQAVYNSVLKHLHDNKKSITTSSQEDLFEAFREEYQHMNRYLSHLKEEDFPLHRFSLTARNEPQDFIGGLILSKTSGLFRNKRKAYRWYREERNRTETR